MGRFFTLSLVILLTLTAFGSVAHTKTLLDTKILFNQEGAAKVTYDLHGQDPKKTTVNQIESGLIFYAYAMKLSDAKARTELMNQVQKAVSKIATDQGLKRPDLLKDNPLLPKKPTDLSGKGFDLIFEEVPGKGNSLEVKPLEGSVELASPAVFYLFQDMVNNLPAVGLRLAVLAMGGMNKWYREVGSASDTNSITQAPSYGLNIAVDIIEKLSGQKI